MTASRQPGIDWSGFDEAIAGNPITGEELIAAGAIIVMGAIAAWMIGRWRNRLRERLDNQTAQFVGLGTRVAQLMVLAVAIGWALTTLGADIGWLTMILVLGAVIFVLGARPILEGMGASAAIVTRPAFSVGDEIGVDDVVGEVVEITNRSTVIRLRDGKRVHIPNVEMLGKTVTVYTVEDERRSAVDITVALGADIDHAAHVLRKALSQVEEINRVGSIRARGIGEGVELSIRFWHPPGLEAGNDAIDAAVRVVTSTLREAGIVLAPTAEVFIIPPENDQAT